MYTREPKVSSPAFKLALKDAVGEFVDLMPRQKLSKGKTNNGIIAQKTALSAAYASSPKESDNC